MAVAVKQMFGRIAGRYDLTNDVLSFGIHRLWRNYMARRLKVRSGSKLLDLCCGTGDVAFEFWKRLGPEGMVVGVDFSPEMVEIALAKLEKQQKGSQGLGSIEFLVADALAIPYESGNFDYVSVAWGIRNVDSVAQCLGEMLRVLRSGGQVVILEFGQPSNQLWSRVYQLYSAVVMPTVGALLTGDRQAYQYLQKTSAAFPCGEKFTELMTQAGFVDIQCVSFMGGIAFGYIATKP